MAHAFSLSANVKGCNSGCVGNPPPPKKDDPSMALDWSSYRVSVFDSEKLGWSSEKGMCSNNLVPHQKRHSDARP